MIGGSTGRALGVALAALAVAVAGCGNDDDTSEGKTLSRSQLVAKGDALCREYNAKQAELGPPKNTRELAEQGKELLPLQEDIGRRFKRLHPSAGDRAAFDRMIAAQEKLAALNRKRYAAAERGSDQAVRELTNSFRRAYPPYVKAAQALGFKVCATG